MIMFTHTNMDAHDIYMRGCLDGCAHGQHRRYQAQSLLRAIGESCSSTLQDVAKAGERQKSCRLLQMHEGTEQPNGKYGEEILMLLRQNKRGQTTPAAQQSERPGVQPRTH